MNIQSIKIALAATALSTLAMGTTVRADEAAPQIEVKMHGYDLGSPRDVADIKSQINRAARNVCGLNNHEGLGNRTLKMGCFRKAVTQANAKVDAQVALVGTKETSSVALDTGYAAPITKR